MQKATGVDPSPLCFSFSARLGHFSQHSDERRRTQTFDERGLLSIEVRNLIDNRGVLVLGVRGEFFNGLRRDLRRLFRRDEGHLCGYLPGLWRRHLRLAAAH